MALLTDNVILDSEINRGEKTDLFTVLAAQTDSDSDRQSVDFFNKYSHGVVIVVKLNAETGAAGFTPKVQIPDNAGNNILWWAGTELTASGVFTYVLFPGGMSDKGAGVTEEADIVMPRVWNFLLDKTTGDTDQNFDTEVYAQYL